jgi:NADPH:quinone reductase-like Zn-dependent oxidoreductase
MNRLRQGNTMNSRTRHPRGTMRAITQLGYGGTEVLSLAEVETPVTGDDEVLIRVGAVGVSAGDILLMHGKPRMVRLALGLRRPRQPTIGRDVAGVVEAVGAQVTRFRVGDAVYAESNQGGYAEFAAVQERFVALRPTTLDAVHASAVPVSGTTALQGLRLAGVAPGQHVLVNGASGGVGGFAVQLAKAMGAEVTGVCRAAKADHVRAIGADHVIDYTSDDFTVGGGRYDVIFDLVADHPLGRVRRSLTRHGTLLVAAGEGGKVFGPFGRIIRASTMSLFVSQRLRPLATRGNGGDLAELTCRIDAGEIVPVIDAVFPLERAAEAITRLESGEVRGKVVITV